MLRDKKPIFIISLVALIIYEVVMDLFQLGGLSIFKIIITVLVWLSFLIAFKLFFVKHGRWKNKMPSLAYYVFIALLFWNLFSVTRTILTLDGTIATIFGNVFTSLSLLVPFVLIFSLRLINIRRIQEYLVILLKIGVLLFVIFIIAGLGSMDPKLLELEFDLLLPVVFLVPIIFFTKPNYRILILISSLFLFYVAFQLGIRTMMIREILLYMSLISVFLYHRYKIKWIARVSFFLLIIPIVLLQQSTSSGESTFQQYLSETTDSDLSTDTRTFLYKEVYQDLVFNNRLWIGKGANGRYYSEYFSDQEGDSDIRLNIEVGILGILLKSGLIGVILNLAILFLAVFYAFFHSKNTYIVGIGYMLCVHTVLLFIENVVSYSTYNFAIWFFIGVCLSRDLRERSNLEIKQIVRTKKIRLTKRTLGRYNNFYF